MKRSSATLLLIGVATSGTALAQTAPGGSNTDVQYNNSGAFGGSNSFTWNGTQVTATGFVATTPSGTADIAIKTNQNGPTTGSQATETDFNQININSDAIGLTAGGVTVNGFELNYGFGGANLEGARSGEQINMSLTGTGTHTGDANPFYTGMVSNMEISGKSGNPAAEAIEGFNAFVNLTNTTTINSLVGYEADVSMGTGTSAAARGGYSAVAYGNVQASTYDAAYTLASNTTNSHGWKNGMLLASFSGGAPLDSSVGCVICTDGGTATIANGINLSSYTISGYPFYFGMASGQKLYAVPGPNITLDNGSATSSPSVNLALNGTAKGQLVANSGYNIELYDIGHGKNLVGSLTAGDVAVGDSSNTQTLHFYGHNLSSNGYLCLTSGVVSTAATCSSSDGVLKNIKSSIDPASALSQIDQLKPVVYTWKDERDGEGEQVGLVAQDVEKVFPSLVGSRPDGHKTLDYAHLVAPLVAAVKELKAENDALQQCEDHTLCRLFGIR